MKELEKMCFFKPVVFVPKAQILPQEERKVIKMSLSSFDKFCENMIKGEPVDNKEIFDERQKMVRSKLAMESMIVYICASLFACLSYEFIYRWAESITFALMPLGVICMVYYHLRCSAKGCLIGVNGLKIKRNSGWTMIVVGGWNMIRYIIGVFDGEGGFLAVKDGMLTVDFLAVLTFGVIVILGIIICVKISRLKKSEAGNSDRDKNEEEKNES